MTGIQRLLDRPAQWETKLSENNGSGINVFFSWST